MSVNASDAAAGTGANSVRFSTTLSAIGNNTGIEVPESVIAELGAGKRPSVRVVVNGYEYRSTVGVMGGKSLISVSAAIRNDTGLAAGDPIDVALTVETTPRTVDVPDDFAAALAASGTRAFFDGLSNSVRRYHIDQVTGAKAADTRQRRIDKAVGLFAAGKQR